MRVQLFKSAAPVGSRVRGAHVPPSGPPLWDICPVWLVFMVTRVQLWYVEQQKCTPLSISCLYCFFYSALVLSSYGDELVSCLTFCLLLDISVILLKGFILPAAVSSSSPEPCGSFCSGRIQFICLTSVCAAWIPKGLLWVFADAPPGGAPGTLDWPSFNWTVLQKHCPTHTA